MSRFLPAGLALAMAAPFAAHADTPADIAALRKEIEAIRSAYESRLQSLEQRLQAAESHAAVAPPPAAAPAAPPVAASPTPSAAVAASGGGANAFNPAMSLILSGTYARTSQDPSRYAISGFMLPPAAEVGPGTRGFSLAESELGFAASIDPWLRGVANIALHADDSVSVEEAYVQTTSLGNGLALKAGRFFSGLGYLNAQHAHTWDFVDNPLAYQALLGNQYGDDGVHLTWLAPIDRFIELGLEVQGDPRLIRVAVENLVGNAWKFSAGRDPARIEFGVVSAHAEPAYFVRDNGAGFDMAYADRLFTPFQRLHSTRHFAGTGVGLATVQRIVQRHGGRVWADAVPEQGATFWFTLGGARDPIEANPLTV